MQLMETLYDVLGAHPDDDAESLKNAYRKAAMANHPDHHADDPQAVVRFTRIARAYDILRDAKRRAAYDRLLERQRMPLRSKVRHAISRPAYQLAFKAIAAAVAGIVLAGGIRLYGIASGNAGGMAVGQPHRIAAVEPAKGADTAKGEAPSELARTPEIPVTVGAAASAVEGKDAWNKDAWHKDAWETAQGPSVPVAAGQTTGSASSIDSAGPKVSAPPLTTAAAAELDRSEVAALLARGRSLLSNGDVAGARVLLRKAAEHNDPQAALALGESYDPVMLKHLGVIKFNGDVAVAQKWYRRAAELGSGAVGDPGRDHGAEPAERPQSTEQKTAAMSQDEVCKRDVARLADLRISQGRDDVIRFERDMGCEKLRLQVVRLRESIDPQ
jgi:curved DNA-binding protein CbpA